jgi:hypothetical protein
LHGSVVSIDGVGVDGTVAVVVVTSSTPSFNHFFLPVYVLEVGNGCKWNAVGKGVLMGRVRLAGVVFILGRSVIPLLFQQGEFGKVKGMGDQRKLMGDASCQLGKGVEDLAKGWVNGREGLIGREDAEAIGLGQVFSEGLECFLICFEAGVPCSANE